MLIYIGVMLVLAFFAYKWSKKGHMIREEYIADTAKIVQVLRMLCVGACISAFCMLLCLLWRSFTGEFLRILAVIAIFIYGATMVYGTIQIYLIQRRGSKK